MFVMYVLFCSMFFKVRNNGFVNAYMLTWLIILNALFVNSIKLWLDFHKII